jgi:hypothetical protein
MNNNYEPPAAGANHPAQTINITHELYLGGKKFTKKPTKKTYKKI